MTEGYNAGTHDAINIMRPLNTLTCKEASMSEVNSSTAPVTVYGLRSSVDGEIRYIGQTTQSLKKRLDAHIHCPKSARQRYVYKWISSVLESGGRVEIFPIVNNAVWNDTERSVIAEYRASGARLANHTDGGDGCMGRVWTDAERKKLSDSRMGMKFSDAHRASMSRVRKGVPISADVAKKVSEALKGRMPKNLLQIQEAVRGKKKTEEHKKKISETLKGKCYTSREKLLANLAIGRAKLAALNSK